MSNERVQQDPGVMVNLFLFLAIGVGFAGITVFVLSKKLRFASSRVVAET